ISSISIGSSNVQPLESLCLPVLFIGMSQSRQHDKSESGGAVWMDCGRRCCSESGDSEALRRSRSIGVVSGYCVVELGWGLKCRYGESVVGDGGLLIELINGVGGMMWVVKGVRGKSGGWIGEGSGGEGIMGERYGRGREELPGCARLQRVVIYIVPCWVGLPAEYLATSQSDSFHPYFYILLLFCIISLRNYTLRIWISWVVPSGRKGRGVRQAGCRWPNDGTRFMTEYSVLFSSRVVRTNIILSPNFDFQVPSAGTDIVIALIRMIHWNTLCIPKCATALLMFVYYSCEVVIVHYAPPVHTKIGFGGVGVENGGGGEGLRSGWSSRGWRLLIKWGGECKVGNQLVEWVGLNNDGSRKDGDGDTSFQWSQFTTPCSHLMLLIKDIMTNERPTTQLPQL
ncbi:hypothetical protein Tco_1248473, partial [Tanacetum coccineum]